MHRYDIWLTNQPEGDHYPLRCTACRERFFDTEDHAEGEVHCRDEDTDEVTGTLKWDDSYDWRDDDPRIP